MPRLGSNPRRVLGKWCGEQFEWSAATPVPELAVCVVTYCPYMSGYYQDWDRIVQICLCSLAETVPDACIMVWDNCSTNTAVTLLRRLQTRGYIDLLLLSGRNVGHSQALDALAILSRSPYVCLTDSDIWFAQGWFEESKHILVQSAAIGAVCACPIPAADGHGQLDLARNLGFTVEHCSADDSTVKSFAANLGVHPDHVRDALRERRAVRVKFQSGHTAWLGGWHAQMLLRRDALGRLRTSNLSGRPRVIDRALLNARLLRLSTERQYVRHVGNMLDREWAHMAARYERVALGRIRTPLCHYGWTYQQLNRLLRVRFFRSCAMRLYVALLKVLHATDERFE